ncbi:MAG: DUF2849 domain-containing protein [Limimaricola sp.]|uniref:DUF2849 domain-containing protein n=1 Tax=Limimaricola sp. TaxID=2211665 RepID=UPI001DFFB3B9|nr:DUF2849 domain-containing protein [Limimaricola sp.]MBI1418439.1 DUF2849 domain-containing protein [Limimaricola sp.]
MSRPFTPRVVTANALLEGDTVWLTPDDRWTRDMHEAELIEEEAHAQLRLLEATAQRDRVVGAYLAEVRRGPHGPEPLHLREALRRDGPSITETGKSAGL